MVVLRVELGLQILGAAVEAVRALQVVQGLLYYVISFKIKRYIWHILHN